jgi:radical SAM protein (TIGR04043 family)
LDVILPGEVCVNCPINETFAAASPFTLSFREEQFVIEGATDGVVPVRLVPTPKYYQRADAAGVPLRRVGQLCADRLGIGLTNNCYYWRSPDRRCKFCSIGLNLRSEQRDKTFDQIDEVVEAAYTDPVAPARHLLLGGGTPDGPDAGARRIAEAARRVKQRWSQPIYAMIVPPEDDEDIDLLKESGVDELGMNIELYDRDVALEIIPGKAKMIGMERYRDALEHAVAVFGPINTRSIMVVGLEPMEATLRGVEMLASIGVMPILSPFRPMTGTELENHPRPDPGMLWELTIAATEVAGKYGLPLGPVCIPCQENTLNLPGHPAYRYY